MAEPNYNLPEKDILLIEDDGDLREMIEAILIKQKYRVVTAVSFDNALNKLLTYRFRLVLSDINLGSSSGLDVLSWIKENAPVVRVVLMTGFLEDTDIHDALELGVFGFLAKPISRNEIKKIVKNALSLDRKDKITEIDYARIDIEDFITGRVLNFPVYIRLKDSRFLKIAHSGTEIDVERLNQLLEKDVSELWIDKEDLPAYLALNEKILSAKTNWSPGSKVKFLNHLVEISHESMRLLQMSDQSIRYCLDSLHILTKEISKIEGSFQMVIPNLNEESRNSKLAVLGASYALIVANILDWTAERTLTALALGAFFRDISLTKEGFVFSDLFNKNANYDKVHYKEHPNRSFQILEALPGFPKESLTIVQQHHEDGTNSGFPANIPKSRVFAPALLVNYVDQMLFYMIENAQLGPEKLKASLARHLRHKLGSSDDKATALILLIEKGDISAAKREFERLKKLSS